MDLRNSSYFLSGLAYRSNLSTNCLKPSSRFDIQESLVLETIGMEQFGNRRVDASRLKFHPVRRHIS